MSLLAQNERLARRVGAVTLLLLAGAIAFVVFLLDKIEIGTRTRIKVYFAHSAGLREKAPIVVGGQPIGHIESVESVLHGGANPLDGEIGTVVTVALDGGEAWKVPAGSDVFVSSRGILSEKYLEVAPPTSGVPGPAVTEGAKLRGLDPPTLDTVLRRTWANMTTFRLFIDEVRPELDAVRGEVATMMAHFDAVAADVDRLRPLISGVAPLITEAREVIALARSTYADSLGGEAGIRRFMEMIARTRGLVGQLRAAIDQLDPGVTRLRGEIDRVRGHVSAHDPAGRIDQVIAQVRAVIEKVDPLLAKVQEIGDRVARGEGSLGRLMTDPEFPEDAKELGKILKRRPWRVIAKPKD